MSRLLEKKLMVGLAGEVTLVTDDAISRVLGIIGNGANQNTANRDMGLYTLEIGACVTSVTHPVRDRTRAIGAPRQKAFDLVGGAR
jgi:hypothetical protein